jgi:hypothetical protein
MLAANACPPPAPHSAQAAASVITAAFPCSHTLEQQQPGSSSSGGVPVLALPEASLLLHCRGRLGLPQLASGVEACRRGCTGVAKFVALALTNSFKVRVGVCCAAFGGALHSWLG